MKFKTIIFSLILIILFSSIGFSSHLFTNQEKDHPLLKEMKEIARMAQQYYRRPQGLGGGGNSYINFIIPEKLATTANGTISAQIEKQIIYLTGISKEKDVDGKFIEFKHIVSPENYDKDVKREYESHFESEILNIAMNIQQYYKKPVQMGGGGNSYKGYLIPNTLANTTNGKFMVEVDDQKVELTGENFRTDKDGKNEILKLTITPKEISGWNSTGLDSRKSTVSQNELTIKSSLDILGKLVLQYYKKPTAMGGGGNEFSGFVIPASLAKVSDGEIVIMEIGADNIIFKGTSKPDSEGNISTYTKTITTKGVGETILIK